MKKSFENRFKKVIETIILPQYSDIRGFNVETFHTRDGKVESTYHSDIYTLKHDTSRNVIMNIKNDTRSMFRFLSPDKNVDLQILIYPRNLN